MKKNWLGRAEANTIRAGGRRAAAFWGRAFRRRPLVPDAAFQTADEAYPGHWRRFPGPITPADRSRRAAAQVALAELPDTWRRVLVGRDVLGHSDARVASELGLSIDQERDILTDARAAVRARLDAEHPNRDSP